LYEKRPEGVVVTTPEDPGILPLILYRLYAEIKLRCTGLEAAQVWLQTLYAGKMSLTLALSSKEWAIRGALGDRVTSGEIPECHRAVLDESLTVQTVAWNQRITDAGRKTQNCDQGLHRSVGKFDLDEELEATIEIVKGADHDHGLAVYATQQKRR
jgi:hypothetical protein